LSVYRFETQGISGNDAINTAIIALRCDLPHSIFHNLKKLNNDLLKHVWVMIENHIKEF